MKTRLFFLILLIITAVFSVQLMAEDEKSTATAPTLSDFKTLVGHWIGEGLGGVCEETWLPESGGSMLGTFKFMSEDKVNFFEIMNITIDSIGPALRVKHFNADMTGWEDKADMVTFRYDSTSGGQLFFGGLTFMHPSEDSLRIGIHFKKSDGSTKEEFINCKKVVLN